MKARTGPPVIESKGSGPRMDPGPRGPAVQTPPAQGAHRAEAHRAGVVAGALLIGGAGAALALPGLAAAADPTPAPAATAVAPSTATGTDARPPSTPPAPRPGGGSTPAAGDRRGHGGPGGLDADDLTAAAKALGMTEADLTTALNGGKTRPRSRRTRASTSRRSSTPSSPSDKAEIAAAVTAGTMTQAQADQRLANLTAHVTDEVNGVAGGPGGHGGWATTVARAASTRTT